MRNLLGRLARRLRPKRTRPVILMYHRVARPQVDPWDLSVTPEMFEDQMRMLAEHRSPLSMADFVARLSAGTLQDDAVAVTFDDGYLDNLETARPILVKHGIPGTVFITTGQTGTATRFWWDELTDLLLVRRESVDVEVELSGRAIRMALPAVEDDRGNLAEWRAATAPSTQRQRIYLEVWRHLRTLNPQDRAASMSLLREALGEGPNEPLDRAMTAHEVLLLIEGGLVTVGGHTVTHPALSKLPAHQQRCEIEDSLQDCARIVGASVPGFAYPYGDQDETTRRLVATAGAGWACSTREAAVNRSTFDLYDLPRIQAREWSGARLQDLLRSQWIDK